MQRLWPTYHSSSKTEEQHHLWWCNRQTAPLFLGVCVCVWFLGQYLWTNTALAPIVVCMFFSVDSIMLVEEGFKMVSVDASDKMLKYALKSRWERRKEPAFDQWGTMSFIFQHFVSLFRTTSWCFCSSGLQSLMRPTGWHYQRTSRSQGKALMLLSASATRLPIYQTLKVEFLAFII